MKGAEEKRVAVVGGGYWGKNLIRNFAALDALHSICDTDEVTLRTHAENYPSTRLVRSFLDVLSDTNIDGVAIATPAATHAELAREALLADKDVFVEKPLCLCERDGRELTELAETRGRILMVGHLLWYHPAVLQLKKLIDEGALGRIRSIYSSRLNLGRLRREENVLWSFAPHDVSVLLGLVGELPESVQAQGGNFLHEQLADTTVSLFNFASGVRAHIFVSWLHPFKEQKLVVVGDERMAVFDDGQPFEQKLKIFAHSIEWRGNVPTASKAPAAVIALPEEEPLRNECAQFLESIRTRSRPRTDGHEGLAVLRVLNACQEAMRSGEAVRLDAASAPRRDYFAHETAVVDTGVEIGTDTKIWHFSHVLEGSRIGRNCVIGQNVMIGPRVEIGQSCKIQNNVSLYEGVTLEDDVFCGPSMVFTNVLNPRAHVSRKTEFRATLVRRGSTIGANSTIVCGHTLGEYCFIGAGAVVTRDVPAHAVVVGNPARTIGWICSCGVKLDESLVCADCGAEYTQCEHGLERKHARQLHRSQDSVQTS